MTDNSRSRKKALIVSMLLFLAAGGGVFLFFVIQGSNDLTGANKKNSFTFGGAARGAATSFFKFVGFDDVESFAKGETKERVRIKEYEAAGIIDSAGAASASSSGGGMPWAPSAGGGRSASPSYVPKMAGTGGSSVGGLGGAGTRSSSSVSRFGGGADAGNTRISTAKPHEAADGVKGSGTLSALAKSRAMLGDGLRSGSAMTAKSKWDASFGVGRTGASGGEMAYGKSGLVGLDKIKKGEVDNLKTTDPKSLKVPEVGKPEYAGDGKGGDADSKKESTEDAMKKSMASSMIGAMGQGMSNSLKNDKSSGGGGMSALGSEDGNSNNGFKTGNCSSPDQEGCSSYTKEWAKGLDKSAQYEELAVSNEGVVVKVTYKGEGPGITDQYKDKPVTYADSCNYLIGAGDPPKVTPLSCAPPMEAPK